MKWLLGSDRLQFKMKYVALKKRTIKNKQNFDSLKTFFMHKSNKQLLKIIVNTIIKGYRLLFHFILC